MNLQPDTFIAFVEDAFLIDLFYNKKRIRREILEAEHVSHFLKTTTIFQVTFEIRNHVF